MRIYFNSLSIPKKSARRVQAFFSKGSVKNNEIKLSKAQEITAKLLGYDDWHELASVTNSKKHEPSLLDENAPAEVQKARIDYQNKVLRYYAPVIESARRQIVLELRVSSANISDTKLTENGHTQNILRYGRDEFDREWRFFPSIRSKDMIEEIWDLYEQWDRGEINIGDLYDHLNPILDVQPENISAIWLYLVAASQVDMWYFTFHKLEAFEEQLSKIIPANLPQASDCFMSWRIIDNREFHRTVSLVAEGLYRAGQFEKAKKWFIFSWHTCESKRDVHKPILDDLNKKSPDGSAYEIRDEHLQRKLSRM